MIGDAPERRRPVRIDAAVLACYNPPEDVCERIATLAHCVTDVIVVDDGSADTRIYERLRPYPNVTVVTKEQNHGIAHSLNIGFAAALAGGARFILTLDQDSGVDEALIGQLTESVVHLERTNPGGWGAVGPGMVGGLRYTRRAASGLGETPEIIQSGAVFTASALRDAGMADESLVIDCVDTDLCLRMRRKGFRIYVDNDVEMPHTIGTGDTVRILGRRVLLSNHRPFRRYYITRNRLIMFRRYGLAEPRWMLLSARRLAVATLLAITVEEDRGAKLSAVRRGVTDFVRGRRGPGRPAR